MVQLNQVRREITLKVVYYGPALSGKTTNLQVIHQLIDPQSRGRLMSLDTADDRTLFFDLLPVFFQSKNGFKVKIKLYTVPGQIMHAATRKIVLSAADGVIFIADSQRAEAKANNVAWRSMMQNLRQNGIDPDVVPIVIQFNKRDRANVRTDAELEEIRRSSKEPVLGAVAVRGEGVLETLFTLLRLTFRQLNQQLDLETRLGVGEHEFLRAIFQKMTTDVAALHTPESTGLEKTRGHPAKDVTSEENAPVEPVSLRKGDLP